MKILNEPIDSFTFQAVSDFCKEGHVENVQIDYKRELPPKGIAKHFAAFSNTRGGVLIIGVEEDGKTGIPLKWEGITYNSKLVDKIHQYATNVNPRPSYEVHVTKEFNSKVFILIRVFEGDRTPYYVQNDANIYIRTGNITDPIGLASPEAAELLFGKKEKSDLARKNYIRRADEIFEAATNRADFDRLKAISSEKENWKKRQQEGINDEFRPTIITERLGTYTSMCTILLQPFYPKATLTSPQEIKSQLDKIRVQGRYLGRFPELNFEPIQDGLLYYDWDHDGSVVCQQIYANGLLYDSRDVRRVDEKGRKIIWLSWVATPLFMLLRSASNFYKLFGYQGGIKGFLRLENIDGVHIYGIVPEGYNPNPFFYMGSKSAMLQKYEWDIDIDTALLHDGKNLQTFYIDMITKIYWSLGYESVQAGLVEKFLEGNGWLVK